MALLTTANRLLPDLCPYAAEMVAVTDTEILQLLELEGLTGGEVAELTGVSVGTMWVRLRMSMNSATGAFSVTQGPSCGDTVASYPNVRYGCAFGNCSPAVTSRRLPERSQLSGFPGRRSAPCPTLR